MRWNKVFWKVFFSSAVALVLLVSIGALNLDFKIHSDIVNLDVGAIWIALLIALGISVVVSIISYFVRMFKKAEKRLG